MRILENRKGYIFIYTILFAVLVFFIFLPFLLRGSSFIGLSDGYNQYYPILVYSGRYYRDALLSIIQGNPIKMFDFTIGFGDDVITTLNWFGFGDIFSLLSIFVPEKFTSFLYTFMILFKLYIAGISFSYYCIKNHYLKPAVLVGAFIYIFSGYTYQYGMITQNFVNVLITLPLFALSIDRILKDKSILNFSKLLVMTTFIQALSGFYFLYMEMLFCFVYFLARFFVCYRSNLKTFLLKGVKFALHCSLGIMMAGIIFIPVLKAYINSPRSEESSFSIFTLFHLYSLSDMLDRVKGLFMEPGFGTGLGITAISAICVIILFSCKRKMIDMKIMICLFLVAYFFPATGIIMNGFSYSIDRWIFILFFLLAVATTAILSEQIIPEVRQSVVVSVVILIWSMLFFIEDGLSVRSVVHVFCMVIIWNMTLYITQRYRKKKKSQDDFYKMTLFITMISLICIGLLNNGPRVVGGSAWSSAFKGHDVYDQIMSSHFAELSSVREDEDFKRTDVYDSSINSSLVTNTNGTSSYYSIANPNLYRFMSQYMISPGIIGSSFTMQGLDGRSALESVLSVNQYADNILADVTYENRYKLPLGFTYSNYISEDSINRMDPLDKNALLMQTVTLDRPSVLVRQTETETLNTGWNDIPIEIGYNDIVLNGRQMKVGKNGIISIYARQDWSNSLSDSEFYIMLSDFIYLGKETYVDLTIGDKQIRLRPQNSYNGQQSDFLVKIPVDKDYDLRRGIQISFSGEAEYSLGSISLRQLDITNYEALYNCLNENVLEKTEINGNRINGTLRLDNPKILFMSIPYSDGWTCKIDGVQTEVYRANTGFCAIEVSAGNHNIEWRYSTPGLRLGIVFTLIGWGAYIFFCWKEKRYSQVRSE